MGHLFRTVSWKRNNIEIRVAMAITIAQRPGRIPLWISKAGNWIWFDRETAGLRGFFATSLPRGKKLKDTGRSFPRIPGENPCNRRKTNDRYKFTRCGLKLPCRNSPNSTGDCVRCAARPHNGACSLNRPNSGYLSPAHLRRKSSSPDETIISLDADWEASFTPLVNTFQSFFY